MEGDLKVAVVALLILHVKDLDFWVFKTRPLVVPKYAHTYIYIYVLLYLAGK